CPYTTLFRSPFVGRVDLTGGANGLDQIDPLNLFGYHLTTTKQYYFYTLISLTLLMTMLYFVNASRTGRAWRALREDPLAAETMSIPVNRLKLLAFMFGAATAGFSGPLFLAMRPWYRPVVVFLGTIAFGFVVHAIVGAAWSRGTAGHIEGGGTLGRALEHWVLLPSQAGKIAGWAYFALIVAALVLTLVH